MMRFAAFPSSPLPFVTASLSHHFPSSPVSSLPHTLRHHFPSSPPCVIASFDFVMYCYVMQKTHTHTPPFINVKSHKSIDTHTTLYQGQVSQFFLSGTRKYCFPTSFDYIFIGPQLDIFQAKSCQAYGTT